jgi:TatA/E family protein of Tat protein translocase
MNVLGMGPMELLLILVLALIVFGPGKLPEIMGQVGRAWRDFQRATTDLSSEFNKTLQAEIDETKAAAEGRATKKEEPAPALMAAPPVAAPATNGSAASVGDHKPETGGTPTGGDAAPPV